MKKLISLLSALFLVSALSFAQDAEPATGGPIMTFEATEVDYGTIEYNSDPYRYFKFENTGDAPLQITNAKGSCGCTVPSYEKQPVFPGESGEIKVRYDTKRDSGKPFMKRITISTNEESGEPRVLTIKGTVLKRTEEPAALPAASPNILAAPDGK